MWPLVYPPLCCNRECHPERKFPPNKCYGCWGLRRKGLCVKTCLWWPSSKTRFLKECNYRARISRRYERVIFPLFLRNNYELAVTLGSWGVIWDSGILSKTLGFSLTDHLSSLTHFAAPPPLTLWFDNWPFVYIPKLWCFCSDLRRRIHRKTSGHRRHGKKHLTFVSLVRTLKILFFLCSETTRCLSRVVGQDPAEVWSQNW